MRSIVQSFVVAPPAGARIRTRLRLSAADEEVVRAVGAQLGRLASQDLACRCRLGASMEGRTVRKRALTAGSSSRWAGAITRTSNDQWQRAYHNLLDARVGLRRAIRTLQARLQVPVGQRRHRVRGYATQAERFEKQRRLQRLQARLDEVERRLASGRVSVCRGGRRLAKLQRSLDLARLTDTEWRQRWEAARWFLTADGDASKVWGNETIRVHPDQHWLELRLPSPLAHLSNTSGRAATYRLDCPVMFRYRGEEWAAQAAGGAVRYDLAFDPARGRWYLDASWRLGVVTPPALSELRQERVLGVDLNADHLACWVLDPVGNPVGRPYAIPLRLADQPVKTRAGRLRAAISCVLRLAKQHGCRSIIVENLNFTDARQVGRERLGRGLHGKRRRRIISAMPTRGFRDLLVGMAANQGLWVIAADPAWTSRWGRQYWQAPLTQQTKRSVTVTGHQAAAVVIGRRGLGLGARRRPGVPGHDRRIVAGELPTRPDANSMGREGPGPPGGQRAAHRSAEDPSG